MILTHKYITMFEVVYKNPKLNLHCFCSLYIYIYIYIYIDNDSNMVWFGLVWLFNCISTFMGYLMPK